MDHVPEEPACHVPETTARNAEWNISIKWAWGDADTELVQVPANSPLPPETVDLQTPFHACGDLLIDQPPCSKIFPLASCSVQVPVTPAL